MSKKNTLTAKNEAAEKKFLAKILTDNEGHKPRVIFTGEFQKFTYWDYKNGQRTEVERERFEVECVKCRQKVWGSRYLNKDGSVPGSMVGSFNRHIHAITSERDVMQGYKDATLVAKVLMRRGQPRELWVVHMKDTDFLDSDEIPPIRWGATGTTPWHLFEKNSRNTWKWLGGHPSYAAAAGKVTELTNKAKAKGYEVEILDDDVEIGVTSVAATVSVSVRKLIDDYKAADAKNPIEVKKWLDRAEDAIVHLKLLEGLRDEIQADFLQSLDF